MNLLSEKDVSHKFRKLVICIYVPVSHFDSHWIDSANSSECEDEKCIKRALEIDCFYYIRNGFPDLLLMKYEKNEKNWLVYANICANFLMEAKPLQKDSNRSSVLFASLTMYADGSDKLSLITHNRKRIAGGSKMWFSAQISSKNYFRITLIHPSTHTPKQSLTLILIV